MGCKFSKLEERLGEYILNTLTYIETVKEFCDGEPVWTLQRKSELKMIRSMKDQADQRLHLEKELGSVLKNILKGLEKLQPFLDAVEKLAITSTLVFKSSKLMPGGVCNENVISVIATARLVSPLLLHFKRDAKAFFLPSFSNMDILDFQLDNYIDVTQLICKKMNGLFYQVTPNHHKSSSAFGGKPKWKNGKLSLEFIWRKSNRRKLYDHLNQLTKIRMDESFRLTFLFGEKAQDFVDLFGECRSRMFHFLSELEKAAVQLDNMKKGSNISAVAGSSVGIAGGVCSIVGLALAPVTAGVSLALTLTGAGLGITSGVNSLVTGITEIAVNSYQIEKANNIFISFREDIQELLYFMGQVASSEGPLARPIDVNVECEAAKLAHLGMTVAEDVAELVDVTSALRNLRNEDIIARTAKIGLKRNKAAQNFPKITANVPDAGQMAKGTVSKSARIGFITLHVFFIGVDACFLYKDIKNLDKRSNEAQLIRSRSVLWRSEVEAWDKIHNHLHEGIPMFSKNQTILEQPFNL